MFFHSKCKSFDDGGEGKERQMRRVFDVQVGSAAKLKKKPENLVLIY